MAFDRIMELFATSNPNKMRSKAIYPPLLYYFDGV